MPTEPMATIDCAMIHWRKPWMRPILTISASIFLR